MAGGGGSEKTEKPTGKKLGEARKRGNVAKSRDLNTAISCLGGSAAIYFSVDIIHDHTRQLLHELWGGGFQVAAEASLNQDLFLQVSSHLFMMLAPLFAVLFIAAIVVNLAQVKFLLAWEAIQPKLSRLSPLQGLSNFCSVRSFLELGKSILKTERAFNIAAGFTNVDDRLPEFFYTEKLPPHNVVFDFSGEEIDTFWNF